MAAFVGEDLIMKRSVNAVGLLLAAGLFGAGCNLIQDYSISSYQGPMPMNDMRIGSGSVAPKPEPDAVVAAQPAAVPVNPAPAPAQVPAGGAPVLNNQQPQ